MQNSRGNKINWTLYAANSVMSFVHSWNCFHLAIFTDIKPKVVHNGKAYGRRSQPDLFDVELMSDQNPANMMERRYDAEESHRLVLFYDRILLFPVSDRADPSCDEKNASFGNVFYELPIRGQGDGLYFEASGQLRNPLVDRLRPKSTSTSLNESQVYVMPNAEVVDVKGRLLASYFNSRSGFSLSHFYQQNRVFCKSGLVIDIITSTFSVYCSRFGLLHYLVKWLCF